jgi:hypothetical protein
VSEPQLYVALSFFCLAGVALVFFIRSGRKLKKNKQTLDEIGMGLAEFKLPEEKAADTGDSKEPSVPH